jgi:sugar/nucleoside kinase (ribokinase family)
VGEDFVEYRSWLERHHVDCSGVRVSQTKHTARFVCTNDSTMAQIASFYAGAMSEAREIELAPIAARVGGVTYVLVAANDPEAMLRHTRECRTRVRVERAGQEPIVVPAVPEIAKVEPTGVGDAFRAGFLAALEWDLSLERAAQLGCLLAVYVVEQVGTQEYTLSKKGFVERFASAYGAAAAAEVEARVETVYA